MHYYVSIKEYLLYTVYMHAVGRYKLHCGKICNFYIPGMWVPARDPTATYITEHVGNKWPPQDPESEYTLDM